MLVKLGKAKLVTESFGPTKKGCEEAITAKVMLTNPLATRISGRRDRASGISRRRDRASADRPKRGGWREIIARLP